MSIFARRMRFALKSALVHLLISALIAGSLALVVFFIWYPPYLQGIVGGLKLYTIVIIVDVVCGPLLTLILASPVKAMKERFVDYTLIGCIQLSALLYGLYMVFEVRPVAVIFEVDRFVVIRPADILQDELPQAPEKYRKLPLSGPYLLGSRLPKDSDEMLESVEMSLSGFEPSSRPSWWVPYDEAIITQVRERAKPLNDLLASGDESDIEKINRAIEKLEESAASLYYLPLTSATNVYWIALLNDEMEILGSVAVNGFE